MRLVLVLLLVSALGVGGYILYERRPTAVQATQPHRGTAAEVVYATGIVEPVYWAKVTPLVRNRIVESCECEGEAVSAGHVLIRLDDLEPRARLAELKAREDYLQKESDRLVRLLERGVATTERFEESASNLLQVQALISAQQERLADYEITAPLDGVVLRLDGEIGEVVEPGAVIAWVGQANPRRVTAEVDEEDIVRIVTGQRVLMRADAFGDRPLEGTISAITPKGDPVNKTYRVRIAVPDDTPLLIGMTAELNIVIREVENTLLIPASALDGETVFVIKERVAIRQPIAIGIRGAEWIEVTSGLSVDDRIVAPLLQPLADGARVRVGGTGS